MSSATSSSAGGIGVVVGRIVGVVSGGGYGRSGGRRRHPGRAARRCGRHRHRGERRDGLSLALARLTAGGAHRWTLSSPTPPTGAHDYHPVSIYFYDTGSLLDGTSLIDGAC